MYAEEKKTNKMRMTWAAILGVSMILLVLFSVLFASFVKMDTGYKMALITVSCCFVLIGIIGLVFPDCCIGYYDCKICHKRFIPSLKDHLFGPHTILKRILRYPNFKSKSWCSKRMSKKD